jgi:hypothetical protein
MKPTKRKLLLHAQTLRKLSPDKLGLIAGAYSSVRDSKCSTWGEDDTNCTPTVGYTCDTCGCANTEKTYCSNNC